MIIGAGLSAADAILNAQVHIFIYYYLLSNSSIYLGLWPENTYRPHFYPRWMESAQN